MYSSCIFCNRPLGANAVLEVFPVGRRIAFDADKGRLWVVCPRCERWNLTPLEERWEAIEQAERMFRDTHLRVSTEHVGLARHPEGLELVRIGRPLRPEFAAWRYGDQFGRRRRRAVLMGIGGAGVLGTIATAGLLSGVAVMVVLGPSGTLYNLWTDARTLVRFPTQSGEVLQLRRRDLNAARLRSDGAGWAVQLQPFDRAKTHRSFTGAEAERMASVLMPRLNSTGARRTVVQESVREIEKAGGPKEYLAGLIRNPPSPSWLVWDRAPHEGIALVGLPATHKLALEMALHEEQERRALDGDLRALEFAWRAAEEVAAIADDLLVSDRVRDALNHGVDPRSSQ